MYPDCLSCRHFPLQVSQAQQPFSRTETLRELWPSLLGKNLLGFITLRVSALSNLLRFFHTLSLEYVFLCLLYTQQILLFNWMVYPITSCFFFLFFCEMYLHMVLLACFFLPFRERHCVAFPLYTQAKLFHSFFYLSSLDIALSILKLFRKRNTELAKGSINNMKYPSTTFSQDSSGLKCVMNSALHRVTGNINNPRNTYIKEELLV